MQGLLELLVSSPGKDRVLSRRQLQLHITLHPFVAAGRVRDRDAAPPAAVECMIVQFAHGYSLLL
jgi:hypothetical protein